MAASEEFERGVTELWSRYRETGDRRTLDQALDTVRRARESAGTEDGPAAVAERWHGILLREVHMADPDVREAAAAAPTGRTVAHGHALSNLGQALRLRFDDTGDVAALDEALDARRRALTFLDGDDAEGRDCLRRLTEDIGEMARADESGIVNAIRHQHAQLAVLRDGPWYADAVDALATLTDGFETDPPDPDQRALTDALRQEAASATDAAHPEFAARQYRAAVELWWRYDETGTLEFLRSAVEYGRTALQATAADDPEFALRAQNLGTDLGQLAIIVNDRQLLTDAVDVLRRAVEATPADDPDSPGRRLKLVRVLFVYGEQYGSVEAFREADQVLQPLLRELPDGNEDRFALLVYGAAIRLRFHDRSAEPRLLSEGIALGREALSMATGTDLVMARESLGSLLQRLYETTGDVTALHEALELADGIREVADAGDPDAGYAADILTVTSLTSLYESTRDMRLLRQAIALGRQACARTGSGTLQGVYLRNALGRALIALTMFTGDREALGEAIQQLEEAANRVGSESHIWTALVANLSTAYRLSYGHTGDVEDLRAAVRYGREVVAAAPENHAHRALYFVSLAGSLLSQAVRTGSVSVAIEAIENARQAVAATTADSAMRPIALTILGETLQARLRQVPDPGMTREAVAVRKAALAALPVDSARVPGTIEALARTLDFVYGHSRNKAVLDELFATIRRGLHAENAENTEKAENAEGANLSGLMFALASAYLYVFEDTGDPEAAVEGEKHYRAMASSSWSPVTRLRGWQVVSKTTAARGDGAAALEAAEKAVALLPLAVPPDLTSRDREFRLAEVAGVGAQAAVAALTAGDPARAVELLEQSRALLIGEAMDRRGAVAELRAEHPELARDFEEVSAEIVALDTDQIDPTAEAIIAAGAGTSAAGWMEPPGAAAARVESGAEAGVIARPRRKRQEAVARRELLLERIRALPEFSGFLAPVRVAQLQGRLRRAPLVLLNAHPDRCDALILTDDRADPVLPVALTGLDYQELARQGGRFRAAVRAVQSPTEHVDTQRRAQGTVAEVLAWLWDVVGDPVLTALGHASGPEAGQPWPRLWWCPTGLFSHLPLHAAGYHGDVGAASVGARSAALRTVLDRVVSSYAVSARGLAYAAGRRAGAEAAGRVLIVAAPQTEGAAALDGVDGEVADLAELLPGATVLDGDQATRDTVLAALPAHGVAHFACHGLTEWTAPRDSRLLLADHVQHPLTVDAVLRHEVNADLAFLSACETTANVPRLADEAIHISAAFQLAGYRHVVGTLWQVDDVAAREVAAGFYRVLTDDGTKRPDPEQSAIALHDAVRRVRDRGRAVQTPTRWAGYVHVGP